jgi:hypothetical protein
MLFSLPARVPVQNLAQPGRNAKWRRQIARIPGTWHAADMADPHRNPKNDAGKKLTVFGEPLWVDALKTLGVGLVMLFLVVVVGAVLGVAVIAPWGRASPDCSIYCVLQQAFDSYFFNGKS